MRPWLKWFLKSHSPGGQRLHKACCLDPTCVVQVHVKPFPPLAHICHSKRVRVFLSGSESYEDRYTESKKKAKAVESQASDMWTSINTDAHLAIIPGYVPAQVQVGSRLV